MRLLITFLTCILLAGSAFADDPGVRDSLIIETVFAELGETVIDVKMFATTDDSVHYYNIPISWNSLNDSSIYPFEIFYYDFLPGWRALQDSIFFNPPFISMLGWSSDHTENKLYTNNNRVHCWTFRFAVDSMNLAQVVPLDTTADPYSGSLLFGLGDGYTSFVPVFIPGAISYGITSDIENERQIPGEFALYRNYPNPFNATTTVEFALPEETEIELSIYNIVGQKVAVIYEGVKPAGMHTATWDAGKYPSGVYFARLESGAGSRAIKMLLLK
ncbi:MAG: T9SS type A sorting domain-containing protein [Candidatus Zixiibacteriota bacterium]|nr:MAG: T9SS type A sorting domain-containing protein [candidate division Zixibacteria bacterium]